MKNQGISLITLIITIIVIIILAAIVIFTGLRTPDSAQFSAFTNDVDTVYTAMIDKFADLKVEHAIKGDYRTNEQVYIELAIGQDPGQYSTMATDHVNVAKTAIYTESTFGANTKCQNILGQSNKAPAGSGTAYVLEAGVAVSKEGTTLNEDDDFVKNIKKAYNATNGNKNGLGTNFKLPTVRQYDDGWYVTDDGRVFNSTGFTYNGNTYFNASYYAKGELVTDHREDRATAISKKMHDGTGVFVVSEKADKTAIQ